MTTRDEFDTIYNTAAWFLASRASWLEIGAVDNTKGGWDIIMRLDGTYYGEDHITKDDMVTYFREQLAEVLKREGIERR